MWWRCLREWKFPEDLTAKTHGRGGRDLKTRFFHLFFQSFGKKIQFKKTPFKHLKRYQNWENKCQKHSILPNLPYKSRITYHGKANEPQSDPTVRTLLLLLLLEVSELKVHRQLRDRQESWQLAATVVVGRRPQEGRRISLFFGFTPQNFKAPLFFLVSERILLFLFFPTHFFGPLRTWPHCGRRHSRWKNVPQRIASLRGKALR